VPFESLLWGITGRRSASPLPQGSAVAPSPVAPANPPPPAQVAVSARNSERWFSFEVVTVNQQGKIVEKQTQSASYFVEYLANGETLEMVAIPGGTFLMGSPESEKGRSDYESPQHTVTIAPFHMGKFAVTQAQYQAVMGNNPSKFKGDNRPVEQVSWDEAIAFCQKLSERTEKLHRLPSEAEWEYACRAGTTTPFHFGETITAALVSFDRGRTVEVGSFPPNGFGLYDMHGNVLEWCADRWHENYRGASIDGSAWIDKNTEILDSRILRGGSYSYQPRGCRSASRSRFSAGPGFYLNGFRVVCSASRTL
jgi:formylglycine-generating enzyme required for sulfatase activity